MIQALKTYKLFNEENFESQITGFMKEKVSIENAVTCYQLANKFHLPVLAKQTFRCMERSFPIVANTDSFLHLDATSVKKLLTSSDLDVNSELQVMIAADAWVMHAEEERTKFSKELLLKVRLPLLSDHVLKRVLSESHTRSSFVFQRNEECLALAEEILRDKNSFYQNKSNDNYTVRYCGQKGFNILVCGGVDATDDSDNNNMFKIDGENTKQFSIKVERLNLAVPGDYTKMVQVDGEVYFLSYSRDNNQLCAYKHSVKFNNMERKSLIDGVRDQFTACAWTDKIYIIGGARNNNCVSLKSCLVLDTKDGKYKFKTIKKMNDARMGAASTVFRGQVVVAGGLEGGVDEDTIINTVEVYDHVADQWSYMSNMIHARDDHHLVSVRNKLFVFGGQTRVLEVYDHLSNIFSILTFHLSWVRREIGDYNIEGALSIGCDILIFRKDSNRVIIYDFAIDKWRLESFQPTKGIASYLCLKQPKN